MYILLLWFREQSRHVFFHHWSTKFKDKLPDRGGQTDHAYHHSGLLQWCNLQPCSNDRPKFKGLSGSKLIWQMSTLYPPYHDCSIHNAADLGHMTWLHVTAESLRNAMKVKKWHFSNCRPHPTTTPVIFFHKPKCSGLNSSTACWSLCGLLVQLHFHPWFCQISFYLDRTSNQKSLEQEWSNIVYNTQGSVSSCTALHTISESVHGLLGNHLWCNKSLDTVLRTEGGFL
jgi:hypothetical protein